MMIYKVFTAGKIRFETINREDALAFAQRIYDREGVIPDVEEHDR